MVKSYFKILIILFLLSGCGELVEVETLEDGTIAYPYIIYQDENNESFQLDSGTNYFLIKDVDEQCKFEVLTQYSRYENFNYLTSEIILNDFTIDGENLYALYLINTTEVKDVNFSITVNKSSLIKIASDCN